MQTMTYEPPALTGDRSLRDAFSGPKLHWNTAVGTVRICQVPPEELPAQAALF